MQKIIFFNKIFKRLIYGRLELISSSGLRSILNAAETMENQGEMKIVNARPEIKEIFEISRFTDFLNFE